MFGQWPSSPEGPAHMVWRDYSDREIYAGARASAANSAALLINPKKDWESEEQEPGGFSGEGRKDLSLGETGRESSN
ncbi:hypothetical protein MY5147_000099 [Beauveria neobassiana]